MTQLTFDVTFDSNGTRKSSGQLPKERAANREKNQPLCMAQYYRLLGSCRRPGDPQDSQYLPEPRNDQHVIVSCRNQVIFCHSILIL